MNWQEILIGLIGGGSLVAVINAIANKDKIAIESLASSLQSVKDHADWQDARIKELEAKVDEMKKSLSDKENEVQQLREEVKKKNDRIAELEGEIKELKSRIAQLEGRK